jgi:hypothetical protein
MTNNKSSISTSMRFVKNHRAIFAIVFTSFGWITMLRKIFVLFGQYDRFLTEKGMVEEFNKSINYWQ